MNQPKHSPEQTKKKIIDVFWELYETKRIEKITVSEVCKLAHINRSTFYAYFIDIFDVLDTIESYYLPTKEKFLEFHNTPHDRQRAFHSFLEEFEKNKKYVGHLLSEHGDPMFAVKYKNAMAPIFKSLLPKKVQDQKTIDLTIEYVLCASVGVITYWFNHKDDISSEELFCLLHNHFATGIPRSLGFRKE